MTAILDAVSYEVVRNRLRAVTEEMRIALQSVSGSPTVTEASDFFTGLYLPDGAFATMGFQVAQEAPAVGGLIRHLRARRVPVGDGDMYIGNDPYVGALHQNDVQMAAPVFAEGRLVAWAGVMAHETDVGGMSFASWCPTATEVYQEGLRIPAVKLVDAGELREDVLEMILAASRLPDALGLDIRAFIATLHVASQRLHALFARYGPDTVGETLERMIADTERQVRRRIQELPDGVVHVRDFLEHDGHENRLYAVDVVATTRGDSLTLDFSGSSPQAPGFVNATRAGLRGGVTGALIPTLGFGLHWNEGLLRPVEIVAPDGLICSAVHPAPVSSATVETIWTVTNVVHRVLNELLACTPEYESRAQAVSSGTMATFNLGGVNQFGERFGLHLLDPLAGGSGAFAGADGINAGGPCPVPVPAIADVETNEQLSPLFYLYRRLSPGSAGSGTRRGGCGAEMAVTVNGVPRATALVMTHGAQVPNSTGLFGGLPGATVRQRLSSSSGPEDAGSPGAPAGPGLSSDPLVAALQRAEDDAAAGWVDLGPKPGEVPLRTGDVFAVSWQGGGGYGDPLARDPSSVAADVVRGHLSPQQAEIVYGVVLAHGDVDSAATARCRRDTRARRLGPEHGGGGATGGGAGGADGASGDPAADAGAAGANADAETNAGGDARTYRLGPALRVVRAHDGVEVRTRAGAVLSRGSTRWRAGAARRAFDVRGSSIELHDDLTMTAWYCPRAGELLAVDVHRRDETPLDDLDLDVEWLLAHLDESP